MSRETTALDSLGVEAPCSRLPATLSAAKAHSWPHPHQQAFLAPRKGHTSSNRFGMEAADNMRLPCQKLSNFKALPRPSVRRFLKVRA